MDVRKETLLTIAIAALVLLGAGGYLSFGKPNLYHKTETPEFCASCHVMETQYDAWLHNGAHRRVKCTDCHICSLTSWRLILPA